MIVQDEAHAYLVGGGIASLAAAAFLIRDGGFAGDRITILEASAEIGGSLDAARSAGGGYVMRGGRMIESKYICTFDLFSSIPILDGSKTVTQEIFEWNKTLPTASKSRLFRDGHSVDRPAFGLSEKHILTLERLGLKPEFALGRTSIADQFEPSFFDTDFWFMWCTTFAFQPWHSAVEFKRYLVRFMHMVEGFRSLRGIMRTVYNQYDSMVRPLQQWLIQQGVTFQFNARVTDLKFCHDAQGYNVDRILCERSGERDNILVRPHDHVMVTLGSMTEGSSLGSMDSPPVVRAGTLYSSWTLWEKLASESRQFGCPATFSDHVDQSKWVSFTTTLYLSTFFALVENLTGNIAGEGGLITFPESNWLLSIVLPHQPHFADQPVDVTVFWGYGLFVDKPGNYVKKAMAECSGREIMTEVMGHLHFGEQSADILDRSDCIPCMMPFITSQFLQRSRGDRPQVVPERSKNLAFLGQFCELPDDVVFTVEYSVRSAQTAVYRLLGLDRKPPPVYKGNYDPRVLLKAFLALHDRT